jgi:hypothetical protein
MQPTKQQLIITGTVALVALFSYAIYTDLTRFLPKKKDDKKGSHH